jgi:hypothetical protein
VILSRRFLIPPLATALALGGLVAAQGEIERFPKIDPYTKSSPETIKKAGYASLGPFRFGDDHTTDQVESTLGGIPLIWVETAHFKLGSGLPEYAGPADKRERARLESELARLAERLPDVKVKTRKLDPWLRLHLFAQRLEDLYADFLRAFDLEESDFPTAPPGADVTGSAYMGAGPYLGMGSKFTVLVLDRKSSLGRYSNIYLGRQIDHPSRWHFDRTDSFLYLTAAEYLEGDYVNDSALACDVIAGVAQNLVAGFRGYRVLVPFAVGEGLAHWFSRRFDPRYHLFSGTDPARVRTKDEWNWAPSVRARAEHNYYPSTHDMLGWQDADALEWADHLVLWSRMDYLFAREDGAAGRFLRLLKDPPAGELTGEQLVERARASLAAATGVELARFDELWDEWVLKTYPKK